MRNKTVFFTAPRQVEIRESLIPEPIDGTVLVKALRSAISSGTELLIYRGQAPQDMPADETISALSHSLTYPLSYGYCMVGQVIEIGKDVDPTWRGKLVFAFHYHSAYFIAKPESLLLVPEEVSVEEALFLPNMETAVNLMMDGRPMIGERVAVFGQGIVGLLTVSLLSLHPLSQLVSFDLHSNRRAASQRAGVHASVNPLETVPAEFQRSDGFDLCYELSGTPAALDQAIALTGFNGRVIIGSWYGLKRASLDLGTHYHRSRMKLISSQVSTIAPDLLGRWTQERRIETAWNMIRRVRPASYITHRFTIDQASDAYVLLDQQPDKIIQGVFVYE
jgi:2-desacetyl-2-hydroxyethyl bacteriochlorophyllide A dehydrogenase